VFILLWCCRPRAPSLFPYTTLFRSVPESEVAILGVGVNPTRTGVLEILTEMGADIQVTNERDEAGEPVADLLVRSAPLHGIRIRSEEHTSELQSRFDLVCRLLLEKK